MRMPGSPGDDVYMCPHYLGKVRYYTLQMLLLYYTCRGTNTSPGLRMCVEAEVGSVNARLRLRRKRLWMDDGDGCLKQLFASFR